MIKVQTQGQVRTATQLDVARRLRQAMDAHRQNKFAEAEQAYRAILDAAPDCFEALHFLGLACLQQNKLPEALEVVSRALKARPQSADSLAMRGVVLSNLGRYAEALQSQDALLALRPESAETHYNRGVSLAKLDRHEEAVASYRRSIALKPSNPQVFHNLGNSLIELGRPQEALEAYEGRLVSGPVAIETLVNRGNALLQLKRFDEALDSFDRALACAGDNISAHIGRGHALRELNRNDEALTSYDGALALDPTNLDALENKIKVLIALDRHADVESCCETALQIAPDHIGIVNTRSVALVYLGRPDDALAVAKTALSLDANNGAAHFNLGNALYELGQYEEAETSFRQAVALAPDIEAAHKNLAGALLALEQFDDALSAFDRAVELCPQSEGTQTNRSLVYLGLGDFKRGWSEYQHRFKTDRVKCWRDYQVPLWDGALLNGPLMVWGEQGLGDQILYASMIPDLKGRVASTILELPVRLVSLFARSFPDIEVIPSMKSLYAGPHVAHIPLGTLGLHLRTTWDDFPKTPGGFLKADPEQAAALRTRLKTDDRLVVGISWRSSNKKLEKAKSAGLHAFAPLLELPNCRFVDLQYGDTSAEREAVERDIGVRVEHLDDIDNFNDIDGLASLITACDLVVTVSNTTAHLAGALGKETYVLVPFGQARMWYWFHDRLDSPFYPEVKIRRQARTHDWTPVMSAVADEIALRRG
jgi:tetratricopeptide (TPR) repeat protein